MTFKPWIPPAGEVVDPPVHPETIVRAIWSDGSGGCHERRAANLNWSGEGDGPKIIAYAVVAEYVEKREPREWWIVEWANRSGRCSFKDESEAADFATSHRNEGAELIHVREVLPAAPAKPAPREVVAWAVVQPDGACLSMFEATANGIAAQHGGTVVKLSGFLP